MQLKSSEGWLTNLLGWLSLIGLFAVGVVGLSVASRTATDVSGALYLLVSGLAFLAVLTLVLRKW